MKYIFCVNPDGEARRAGMTSGGYDTVVSQDNFPAREYREGYEAVLMYNEEDGVHWEYVKIPAAKRREHAYETLKCITYGDQLLTVDEANKLWQEYEAEGSDRAPELTALIAAAKAQIREMYPDENEAVAEDEPSENEELAVEESTAKVNEEEPEPEEEPGEAEEAGEEIPEDPDTAEDGDEAAGGDTEE